MVKSFLRRLRVSVGQDQFGLDAAVQSDTAFSLRTASINSFDDSFDISDCSLPSSEDNFGTPPHAAGKRRCREIRTT